MVCIMQCKYHPTAQLEEVSIKTEQKVPWSDSPVNIFQDVQFCTQCWKEHELGHAMRHELIMTEEDHLEQQIDNHIARSV